MKLHIPAAVRVSRALHLDLILAALLASPALLFPNSVRALHQAGGPLDR